MVRPPHCPPVRRPPRRVAAAATSTWADGVETLERIAQRLRDAAMPAPRRRTRRPRFDECNGDEVDTDRLRSGQAFWRTTSRETTSGPATITIVSDMATPGSRSGEELFWRGAAAVVLAEMLEAAGYRVELWAANHVSGCYFGADSKLLIGVCLKRTGETLDRATLAAALSAWFYRTVNFQSRHAYGNYTESARPERIETWQTEILTSDPNCVVMRDVWTESDAAELIRKTLASLQAK